MFVEIEQCRSRVSHNPGMDKVWAVGCSEFEELFWHDVFRGAMNNTPGGAKWWLHVGGNSVAGARMRRSAHSRQSRIHDQPSRCPTQDLVVEKAHYVQK